MDTGSETDVHFFLEGTRSWCIEFTVIQGDIAAQRADALVNAAGTSLRMGSGVAGAFDAERTARSTRTRWRRGPSNSVTSRLPTPTIAPPSTIHAAAMLHHGDGRATAESIREATRSALERADELGYESLVVPVLGTGAAGFSFADGARYVCEEVWSHEPATLTDVRIVAYAPNEYERLHEIGEAVRAR